MLAIFVWKPSNSKFSYKNVGPIKASAHAIVFKLPHVGHASLVLTLYGDEDKIKKLRESYPNLANESVPQSYKRVRGEKIRDETYDEIAQYEYSRGDPSETVEGIQFVQSLWPEKSPSRLQGMKQFSRLGGKIKASHHTVEEDMLLESELPAGKGHQIHHHQFIPKPTEKLKAPESKRQKERRLLLDNLNDLKFENRSLNSDKQTLLYTDLIDVQVMIVLMKSKTFLTENNLTEEDREAFIVKKDEILLKIEAIEKQVAENNKKIEEINKKIEVLDVEIEKLEKTEGKHPDFIVSLPTGEGGEYFHLDQDAILHYMNEKRPTAKFDLFNENCALSVKNCILVGYN